MDKGIIQFYEDKNGKLSLKVKLSEETVWLTQKQMAELFDKNIATINEHIKNIFSEDELNEDSVIRESLITATDGKTYKTKHYNLDVIISIGYRVKSKTGTEFRKWATRLLKDYLIDGYILNERKLEKENTKLKELHRTIEIIENAVRYKSKDELTVAEASGIIKVVTDYKYALDLLDKYDHQALIIEETTQHETYKIDYDEAISEIKLLKETFNESINFGIEKDESFKGSISAIYQTFDGQDLYGSVEEKSAHLLYFICKNHSFIDGNKRIGASLFLRFLDANNALYRKNNIKRIADNTLVAITLMIATSKPEEKETLIKIVVNLINKNN